ncbi:Acyl-CoA N-acyltransferase with RING/FYVE/PHD-type zinc finger domain [Striga hermonthica]|uniref:Acyl-CoA N-acyltransferase with RING/FYVE/PHD-type zinc finger domain n=1 Tax=Striga hermonthica TaxID=68872 RepID=A0A9N7RQ74_STRHE|nr:Acyl-CoA N-acyltransferase with RING/FYVE/PHD-type zinc finger domain [Striga hermonthica]
MVEVKSRGSRNSKDMDPGEIELPSIKPGLKREYNMMMKAQGELIRPSREGWRVTRSQSAGGSRQRNVKNGGKIKWKVKEPVPKKLKKDNEGPEEEDVDKLENIDVPGSNKGRPKEDVVHVLSDTGHKSVNVELEFIAVDESETQKLQLNSREEGNRKILENGENLASDEGSKGDVVQAQSNLGYDSRSLEENLDDVGRSEAKKKLGADSKKAVGPQLLCTKSPLSLGGVSDIDFTHEGKRTNVGASDLGREEIGEAASRMGGKPLRRYARAPKQGHDESFLEALTRESRRKVNSTDGSCKREIKMSKKVELKRVPLRLKDLLETGLLEGLRVKYIHISKRRQPDTELEGVIKATGILCSCGECKWREVVTPNVFEMHAKSGNKRPPEYIYLENGKSLRDVLDACKTNESESLALVIQNAIGHLDFTTALCINCKGLIPEAGAGRPMLLCDSCVLPKDSDPGLNQSSEASHKSPLAGPSPLISSGCLPEVPGSAQISSNNQPQRKRQGKLTRKDLRMHKSVLAEDLLPDGTPLSYVMHGKRRLKGYKKDGSIFCTCCNGLVSPSQFEAHAGFPSRRKPYMSIYTFNGVSLHQLSLELSKNGKPSSEENDDLCSICEDGGNLLCCNKCPRAFHPVCVGLSSLPEGTWYCKYCKNMFEREKFAERNANAIAAGRVPGADALAEITQRCIRIVPTFEADIGGCAICRGHDFSNSEFSDRTVIICDQCEKEHHISCLKEQGIANLEELPEGEWFCSERCITIHVALQKFIGAGEQSLPEDLINILRGKIYAQSSAQDINPQGPPPQDIGTQGLPQDIDAQQDPGPAIRWRLLNGKKASEDARVWLSGAVSIFHDRFDPIADSSTGCLDLIPHMVYGRAFKDQDFCGMYCATLFVGSVVVSAGIVRIFGEEVAELPLVATKTECQGKGYFQSLYFCIERLLASLGVKDLVLAAAEEAESLWKNRFGFEKLGEEELEEYQKKYQMMIFQGTSVLHKAITNA